LLYANTDNAILWGAVFDWTVAHIAARGGNPICLYIVGHSTGGSLCCPSFAWMSVDENRGEGDKPGGGGGNNLIRKRRMITMWRKQNPTKQNELQKNGVKKMNMTEVSDNRRWLQ